MTSPSPPPLPKSLQSNPRLGQWLRIRPDGEVHVCVGKVEIGQGIATALLQMAAEALEVDPARIRMVPPSTAYSPDEGVTSGSLSIQDCGRSIRHVCAEVRELFRQEAAARFGTQADALTLDDGTIIGPGNARTSYWELADAVSLDRPATSGDRPVRRRAELPRVDISDKVFGRPRFIHDMRPEGMVHGRAVHPPRIGARRSGGEDLAALAGDDVRVIEDGAFIGLVSDSERAVETAAMRLREKIRWDGGETLPEETELEDWLRSQPVEPVVEAHGEAPSGAPRTLSRSFFKPFIAHGSMAPSCALAIWQGEEEATRLRVWTHSQGIYNLRADLALVLGIPPASILVEHVEGAGCYGHNPADDVALDAALLARACPGRVVRVQWSREDELAGGPFGPAMVVDLDVDLDARGDIVGWRHTIWSNGHSMRPGRGKSSTLRAAAEIDGGAPWPVAINMPASTGGGADRNAVPLYDFHSFRVTNNHLTVMPIRTSAMRALGAFANVFAIESMMDEVAGTRGEDPIAFRLRHLRDARARAVIEEAAHRGGWSLGARAEGRGRGFAFARYKNTGAYCAVVADITCEDEVRVNHLTVVVDVGEVISRDGVINQVEGGAIQATSWALKEAVRFDRNGILSRGWETYPILRFSEVPSVEVHIMDRPDVPPLGAGEASQGPTGAAIANAVFHAVGVRVTRLPFTRDNLIAAMELAL